ncbi:sigma-E factor negative regulatory protein [Alcanivorax sp. S6407]|uniref:sigma-E factor negative regulatory protein n=1 Tax=Alcanivorax sp. S6407 TaxID=2926424 RepID=UPI001FF6DD6A|nr:sigma-E factor negative regulatory protein [Alcanivorax sp. S6407]MCK0152771.1 sigma-E factor negative regulatory protein [Alcanivorax sp. S6407]
MNRDLETLSAFLDGETSELETRRVMRDVDDAELDTLSRWQLARDVMHGHASTAVPKDFNAGLSAALAAEGAQGRRPAWLGGMARLAVAASVAAATVVGWQTWEGNLSGAGEAAPALAAAQDTRLTRPFAEASLVSQSFAATPAAMTAQVSASPRVNEMLLRHSDFAARNSGQGMMPLARLVSMDARSGAK